MHDRRVTDVRTLTFYGLLAGVCPLIPIPFLDDAVLLRVRRRLAGAVLADAGVVVSQQELRRLAGEEDERRRGCVATWVVRPIFKLTFYLVKKLFKKLVVFLTFKDCIEAFSTAVHHGYLLGEAAASGKLGVPGAQPGLEPSERVREAIRRACAEVDPRPIHQLVRKGLRGSRFVLVAASRRLARLFRRSRTQPAAADEAELDLSGEELRLRSLLDRLSASLWVDAAYWRELGAHFEAAWAAAEAVPESAPEPPAEEPPRGDQPA